jgi:SNF2 family DNA or RNA helicase
MIEGVVSLKAGKYMRRATITKDGSRLFVKFGFNKPLLEEVRAMQGAKWHQYDELNPRKIWSVTDCARNRFQLQYLMHPDPKDPLNPYWKYDQELIPFDPEPRICPRCQGPGNVNCRICKGEYRVKPYSHQIDMARLWLTVHQCLWAVEMGGGKTLAAIMTMEKLKRTDCLWIGPKSALESVKLEFDAWRSKVTPRFYTYDGLKKLVETWPKDKVAPELVVFDESSRLKNPTAQRTQAAMHLVEGMRAAWGDNAYVLLMSGSPAPKAPTDYFAQCEIAAPGFLKEGSVDKFKRRLAIITERESMAGGVYPHLVGWRDDPRKCDVCGEMADAPQHQLDQAPKGSDVSISDPFNGVAAESSNIKKVDAADYHAHTPSKDEVSHLYKRMRGLVCVKFKKDILDLPDKIFRQVVLKPTQSTLNAARAISARAPSAIQALTQLRELSDGFQYQEIETGLEEGCSHCHGSGKADEHYDANDPDNQPSPEEFERGYRFTYDETTDEIVRGAEIKDAVREVTCDTCGGTGSVVLYRREAIQVPCPKEDGVLNVLDELDDVGRVVIFAGFTGSVDRCTSICEKVGWTVVRVDGRGWKSSILGNPVKLLKAFQYGQVEHPRLAFVMHPGSGGMGLNLTASPVVLYYSNDFNGESRIQSEERCHRPGMDLNKSCTIIDLLHLPSDLYVLENLQKKRRLQDLSLGQFREAVESKFTRGIREL